MPFNPGQVRKVNALGGKRPQATGIVLIPKNGDRKLATSNGSTANYGGNTKFGLFPNVGMSYLFQNKIGVGSLFNAQGDSSTIPAGAIPAGAPPIDGPGISLLPLDASEYVGPEGTFTFTAGTFKVNGVSVKNDHVGFAYLYTFGNPDDFTNDGTFPWANGNSALSTTNFPFGSVSGNRKILNGQAEIARMVSDSDAPDDNDFFINIYSNQLSGAQLTTALSNLNIEITYPSGYSITYSFSSGDFQEYIQFSPITGDAAPNNGGVWKIRLTSSSSNPLAQDDALLAEGQQYSVVVTTQ